MKQFIEDFKDPLEYIELKCTLIGMNPYYNRFDFPSYLFKPVTTLSDYVAFVSTKRRKPKTIKRNKKSKKKRR